MEMAPICTPTAAARWLPMSPAWPQPPESSCATCISPSPAWKIFFCTIPEGACANELESFLRYACARRARRPPQLRGALVSNFPAAADVRLHLRPRDGRQRLHAAFLQKSPAPGNHGHLHGRHRHLGRGYATDCRISVHARDRRPPARSDGNFLAGDREGRRRHAASAGCRLHGHSRGMVAASAGRGVERAPPAAFCWCRGARGALFRHRRSGVGLHRGTDSYRFDVQPGGRADDFLRLHLLSLERAGQIPHPAKSSADQSPRLCQRRSAWHDGAAVPASALVCCPRRAGIFQRSAPGHRPPQIPRKSHHLILEHAMRFAKIVFWIAGIWGLLILTPLYFMFDLIGRNDPPPITHPGFFYGFVGAGLAWQVAFIFVATDTVRYRPLMIPSVLEKVGYGAAVIALVLQGRMHKSDLLFAGTDLFLGLLFVIAYFKTPRPSV